MLVSSTKFLLLSSLAASVLATPVILDSDDTPVDPVTYPIQAGIKILKGPPELISASLNIGRGDDNDELSAAVLLEKDDLHDRAQKWSNDQKMGRKLHSGARAKKGLKGLAWDAKLTADAEAWAKELVKKGSLQHSPNESRPGQGENLAWAYSSDPIKEPIAQATKMWLAEEPYYKGETIPNGNFQAYGHYTQCMWNATTKVGIATVSDGKGAWYTVARYSPAGNVVGQTPYKV